MTIRQYPLEWRKGQWKATCDRCGFDYHSPSLRLEWTGLRVCSACFDTRHPQDYLQGKPDLQAPEWVRNPGDPVEPFVNENGTDITADDL